MKKNYEVPILLEQKVVIKDVIAESGLGSLDYIYKPGDHKKIWDWSEGK